MVRKSASIRRKRKDILKKENDQKVFRCVIGNSDIFDEEKDLIVCADYYGEITLQDFNSEWDETDFTNQVTRVCYEIDVSEFEGRLDKWKTNIQDVYSYENLDDLNVLYDELSGSNCVILLDYDTIDSVEDKCGLVFYYTEYDDYACGDPYSRYVKVISGAKL